MKNKINSNQIINKKNILTKRYFFNLFLLLTMTIATTGGIGYYFFNECKQPVYEIIVNKNTKFPSNNDDYFDDYNNKIKQLNEEITIKNEELKDSNLTEQEKTVIEKIVKLKTQQKIELETDLLLKKFLKTSEEEILEIDNKIKKNKSITRKTFAYRNKIT